MKEHFFKRKFTSSLDGWLKTEEKVFYISGPEHVGKETTILRWLKKKPNLVIYSYNKESREALLNLDECLDSLVYKDNFYNKDSIIVIFNAEKLGDKLKDIIDYIKKSDKIQCKVLVVANSGKYSGGENLKINTLDYEEFQFNLNNLVDKKYITKDYYKIVGGYPTAILKFIQGISYGFSDSILISVTLEAHFNIKGRVIRDIREKLYDKEISLKEVQKIYDKIIENMVLRHTIKDSELVEYLLDTMILINDINNRVRFNDNGLFLASVIDKRVCLLANNQDIDIKTLIELNNNGFELLK